MKKKGFTLVELLAVIVILAIIALIAIPLIGNVIEKAKIGALESSVNGLVESANMYYANNTIKGETISETTFDFEDGEQISAEKLEYKGKVYNGKLILHANGEVAVCIDDESHYAYKNKDTDEIVSGVGTCVYDGTTGNFSSNSSINDLRGKTLAANNISQSEDGLNALIKIPEEGHYDKNSIISVPIDTIQNEVNLNNIQSGTFTATVGVWENIELGYKPTFVQLICTEGVIAGIQYSEDFSPTKYLIGIQGTTGHQAVTLGNTPSYGYYNFKITDTGFQFWRNYNNALTYTWVAGKI